MFEGIPEGDHLFFVFFCVFLFFLRRGGGVENFKTPETTRRSLERIATGWGLGTSKRAPDGLEHFLIRSKCAFMAGFQVMSHVVFVHPTLELLGLVWGLEPQVLA